MKEKEVDISSIIAKIELGAEIARIALRCPTCHKAVKRLFEGNNNGVNPIRGRSSLEAMNERDGFELNEFTHRRK